MRTGIFGVGFAALLLAMLATGCDPRNDSSLPPVGSYRISNLDSMRREDPLTRASGKVAIFQVDYQGPREWAEVVVEHWRGSERLGTDVIMRMKFGSRVVERHDWG